MKKLVLVVAAVAVLVSACQSASEQLTEQILEQQDGVDNVEFDADSGEVSVETEDGSITIGGGEVPAGFPVPFPDGYEVTSVFDSEGDSSVAVLYSPDRYDELVSFYENWTASQPGEWSTTTNTFDNADGKTIRAVSIHEATTQISIIDCPNFADGSDAACVNVISQA